MEHRALRDPDAPRNGHEPCPPSFIINLLLRVASRIANPAG